MNMQMTGGNYKAQSREPLTLDRLAQIAPSVFAEDKHASRSDRYTYIPTREVVAALIGEGFQPVSVQQQNVRDQARSGFQKHLIRFRQELDTSALTVGSEWPELALLNSHDGSSSYQLMGGMFRLWCLNGCYCGKSYETFKARHSGNVVAEVIEAAHSAAAQFGRLTEQVARWKTIELNRDEFHVLAESAAMLRFDVEKAADLPATVDSFMRTRRVQDAGADLWTRFNVVQEHTIKGGVATRTVDANNRVRRGHSRAVKGIDQNVSLNRALWNLAERMAELKSGAA